MENTKVSIVVLNYNDAITTSTFVKSINDFEMVDHIVVVDNCSNDGSYEKLLKLVSDKIDVIQSDRNGGYGYGNNYGIRYLKKKYDPAYVAISNPDVEISSNTIEKCLDVMRSNCNCAVVAPMMKMSDNTINYKCAWKIPTFYQYLLFSLVFLGRYGNKMYYSPKVLNQAGAVKVGCVAGSFLIVNLNRFSNTELYDENIFLFCEETVLGIKVFRMRFETILLRDQFFIHHHSVSINKSIKSRYRQKAIMWKSREYVLNTYYTINWCKKALVTIIKTLSLLETRLLRL